MHVGWQAQYKRHPRHVRRSGSRFPERDCILEHQISRSAKMILHDSHGTSYDLAPLFRGRRSTLETWDRTIAKRIGTRPLFSSALNCPVLKERSLRFCSWQLRFLENVSQNCCVFDVVSFQI